MSCDKRLTVQKPNDFKPVDLRLVELDWLRVLAFGLLILYHVGMLYTEGWGWHYKSQYSSSFLANLMLWSNQWRMSLLFFISGAALSFVLKKQSGWQFARKRIPQLLLPLIFGMLVIVVPQVYVEANSTSVIVCPNFWHFWYIYLDQQSAEFAQHKTLGAMHLTWNHLWFLPYLLAYSLIIAGIFPLLHANICRRLWRYVAQRLRIWQVVFLPIPAIYLIGFFLYANHPVTHNFVDDWWNHARSFLCFMLGYGLVQVANVWRQLSRWRWQLLVAACGTYAYCLYFFHGGTLGNSLIAKELMGVIWSANMWLWMLALIAWAQHGLKHRTPLLAYLNGGVFCFYVLHQTLIIIFAYWLTPLKLGPVVEPILVTSLVIFFCLLLYEIIRRLPAVPILFGARRKL